MSARLLLAMLLALCPWRGNAEVPVGYMYCDMAQWGQRAGPLCLEIGGR